MALQLTVQNILDTAHKNYEQGTDVPTITDEDGQIRLALLQQIVDRWRTDNTTRWAELFAIETVGPIAVNTTEYDLPDDYDLPEAFYLQDEDKPLPVKKPWQITGVEGKFVYILGNPDDGYRLVLGWTPTADDQYTGKTIRVVYYNDDTAPLTSGQILKMSNPHYAIYELTAELFVNDDTELYTKWHNEALNCLANMRQRNDQTVAGESTATEPANDENDFNFGE